MKNIFIFAVLIPILCTSKENRNALNSNESRLNGVGYKPFGGWANLYNMKLIPLTQGKYGETFALVDDEDYEYLINKKWAIKKDQRNFYAQRTFYIDRIKHGESMHRVIMKAEKQQHIDHIDGNGLNNQKSNLRFATRSQNMANRKPSGKSKYLGVFWHKHTKKWCAQIRKNNLQIFIGYFKIEEEAALAYNKKASEIHGEFANLNIIKKNG